MGEQKQSKAQSNTQKDLEWQVLKSPLQRTSTLVNWPLGCGGWDILQTTYTSDFPPGDWSPLGLSDPSGPS